MGRTIAAIRARWDVEAGQVLTHPHQDIRALIAEIDRLQDVLSTHQDCDVLVWNNTGLELTVCNLTTALARVSAERDKLAALAPVSPCATCHPFKKAMCFFSCAEGDHYFSTLKGDTPQRASILSRIFAALGSRFGGHF
jgi:hypothetical protein